MNYNRKRSSNAIGEHLTNLTMNEKNVNFFNVL